MIYGLIFFWNNVLYAICDTIRLRRSCFRTVSNGGGQITNKFTPFELSAASDTAGAFPDDTLDAPGLVLSERSGIGGCELLLALGTALDWLSAGDFVCELDAASDTDAVVGTLDRVTGVWFTLAG
jgi:hypothetical protein